MPLQKEKMKQFIKIVFASMIGTSMALGFLLFSIISLSMTLAVVAGGSQSQWKSDFGNIRDSSVLKLVLDGSLKDRGGSSDYYSLFLDSEPSMGLYEITRVLREAAGDQRIKGLFMEFRDFQSGSANAESLRREVINFKKSGKFVMAYAETYGERDYIVASAADEVILYPRGNFHWNGLATELMYFKNTLDKLEVVPQVFRVGRYKSAVESFTREKMSEDSRQQISALLKTQWRQLLDYAKEKTQLSLNELNALAGNLSVFYADQAKEKGFVDQLASMEEVENKLMELTGTKEKPNYVGWKSFHRFVLKQKEMSSNGDQKKVALVFANGSIYSGQSSYGDSDKNIYSVDFSKMLKKIRRDKDIKAVVLRVNSPGGSALASDVIWTSTQWLKAEKPLVTSFGNVAASGGYYISAGSQYIFSEPTTITGSIGVFGLIPATERFFNNKLGMTFDGVKTHSFSDISILKRPFNSQESAQIQGMILRTYKDFLKAVTDGRQTLKTVNQTHEIAQGRVWTGKEAMEKGLVDELGSMEQAIVKAAKLAGLDKYQVEVYPRELSPFEEIFYRFADISSHVVIQFLPDGFKNLLSGKKQEFHEKIQTRIPFDMEIN